MSAAIKQIAGQFLADARANPNNAPEICRQAALTFMGLAQDPKNALAAKQLANLGLEFANAATQPVVMDDFTDLLRETQTAYDEVGDDPMDLIARRRELHDARTPRMPGFTSIAPESFNRDATLGRSAVIKFAPTTEEIKLGILQAQNVAFWQGVKKEAQAMTVDISLGFLPMIPADFGIGTSVRPYAEVEYGSDGNRTKVKFDVAFGKRVTVVGNYIAVTLGMDPPQPTHPTVQLTAGASIGTFAAPSHGPTVLTAYVDGLDPNLTSDAIPIPMKAVQLLPLQSRMPIGDTAELAFFNYGGSILTRVFYKQSDTSWMQPVPITGDVAFIKVSNTGLNTTDFRLPFQLAM